MNNIISISNLNLVLKNHHVLNNINLDVQKGINLAIMGRSGSGKSSLAKTIIGFFKKTDGSIKIHGKETIQPIEENIKLHNIGFIFQQNALFDSLTIWENISFGIVHKNRISRKIARQKAIEQLQLVGLDKGIAYKYPRELSGGMQKRVAILRTIILQPEIIIFDEPTSGLDHITSNLIANFILNVTKNNTNIVITHDVQLANRIADKLAIIEAGEIIWYGSIDEIKQSENQYAKEFIAQIDR